MPAAAILGCAGAALSDWERRFFAETDPLGFILFLRNCETPAQVRALIADLRETVGRADAPVLIDQEGGRVARLKPPHWQALPPAGAIGALYGEAPEAAAEAAWLQGRLIAWDLADLGVTVDCAPVLDLRLPETHDVIGDRAFGAAPDQVARLGRAFCEGLLAGGVLPVIKHVPGHGRARADSHHALPVVETPRDELERSDFAPFRELADMPLAMTAHICFTALDPEDPVTTSARIVEEVIRGSIGFDGLLYSDDLSMKALAGGLGERAAASLAAGCDLALHCNGDPDEMADVMAACGPMTPAAAARWAAALERLRGDRAEAAGPADLRWRLDALLQAQ